MTDVPGTVVFQTDSAAFRGLVLLIATCASFALPERAFCADPATGYQPRVAVIAGTRLDWVFAIANQSPAKPPPELLDDYDSRKQRYELFVPADYTPKKRAYPLVLFLPASGNPAGWGNWKSICEQQKVLFASPFDAGNDVGMERRVRLALDVLDDVRRHYRTDPDRTCLGGFSGGARVAATIASTAPNSAAR